MGIVAIETWLRAGETLHSLTLRRVRLRPELNFGGEPDDVGFVSSLLGNHPEGFDPTEDDGGVPEDEVAGKRADYLRAEAACFEAHGYFVR